MGGRGGRELLVLTFDLVSSEVYLRGEKQRSETGKVSKGKQKWLPPQSGHLQQATDEEGGVCGLNVTHRSPDEWDATDRL